MLLSIEVLNYEHLKIVSTVSASYIAQLFIYCVDCWWCLDNQNVVFAK